MLEIDTVADDGYPDESNTEPDPRKFRSPEETRTFFSLYAWQAEVDLDKNWYFDIWKRSDYPEKLREVSKIAEGSVKACGARYALSELSDDQSLNAVLTDFRNLLTKHAFNLEGTPRGKTSN